MNLEVSNLNFTYSPTHKPVLHDFNLSIGTNVFCGVLGPNGSGKSTFFKLISGILSSSFLGSIKIDHQELTTSDWSFRTELAKKISYIPGYFSYEQSTFIIDFILQSRFVHGSFFSRYSKQDLEIADFWCDQLNISSLKDKQISEVSTGQLQLALFARAFAQNSEIIILDETFSNIDFRYQLKIFDILERLHSSGKSIFIISHDINLIAEFCPSLLWIADGKNKGFGDTRHLLTQENIESIFKTSDRLRVTKNIFSEKPQVVWQKQK